MPVHETIDDGIAILTMDIRLLAHLILRMRILLQKK